MRLLRSTFTQKLKKKTFDVDSKNEQRKIMQMRLVSLSFFTIDFIRGDLGTFDVQKIPFLK